MSSSSLGYNEAFTPEEFIKTFPDLNGKTLMVDKFPCYCEDVCILVNNHNNIPPNTWLYDHPDYSAFRNYARRYAYLHDDSLFNHSIPSGESRTRLPTFRDLTLVEGVIDLCKENECCLDIIYLTNEITISGNIAPIYVKTRPLRYYYEQWLLLQDTTSSTT